MPIALFPGRFQPLHIGHFETLKHINLLGYQALIGVGSVNQPMSKFNPFTYDERIEMIKLALQPWAEGQEYMLVPLTDIGDNKKWAKHVCQEIIEFDVVFSNSPITKKLFRDIGFKVYSTAASINVSASYVRELIYAGDEWEHLVPFHVKQMIKYYKAEERIKLLIDEKWNVDKGEKVA